MDNILKSTARNEIQNYMSSNNICGDENSAGGSHPSDKPFSKPRKRKTEGRLNLLNTIRSNSISTGRFPAC